MPNEVWPIYQQLARFRRRKIKPGRQQIVVGRHYAKKREGDNRADEQCSDRPDVRALLLQLPFLALVIAFIAVVGLR